MASTSVTRIGGVMVVTQVIPQDEGSIQLQNPASTIESSAGSAPTPTPAPPPAKMDTMKPTLMQGDPQCLGVIQIVIGLLCTLYSINGIYSPLLYAPFCLAYTFVVSGSVTVSAHRKDTIRLVGTALVWNVLSVLVGIAGVAFMCWQLAADPPTVTPCLPTPMEVSPHSVESRCLRTMRFLNRVVWGLRGTVLVLLVLEVCVAITASVFSVKAIRSHRTSTQLTVESGDRRPLLPGVEAEERPRSSPESP